MGHKPTTVHQRHRSILWHLLKEALKQWGWSLWRLVRAILDLPLTMITHTLANPFEAVKIVFWSFVIVFAAHIGSILQPVLEEAAHITWTLSGVIDLIFNVIRTAFDDIVGAITSLISAISSIFGGPSISAPDIPKANLAAHMQWASQSPPELCAHFHNTWNVLTFASQRGLNAEVCPVVRYTWGTWVHVAAATLLGWAYIDDTPGGNNCGVPDGSIFCEVANVWRIYWILIAFMVGAFFAHPLRPVLAAVLLAAAETVRVAFVATMLVLRFIVYPSRFTAATERSERAPARVAKKLMTHTVHRPSVRKLTHKFSGV